MPIFSTITEDEIITFLKDISKKNSLFASPVDLDALKTAFIGLFNRMNGDKSFNANVLVCAADQDVSNQYGTILGEMLEKYYPDICLSVAESDFYYKLDNNDPRYESRRVLIVKNYEAASPDELYRKLSEIEMNEWLPAVILCTNTSSLDKLKEYELQDYRLFHYLCGYKVIIHDINESNIPELTFEMLENHGFKLTDDFRIKLNTYIKAVYPEAVLSGKAFSDDLVCRILQTHYHKINNDLTLDETDVPYSIKAKDLENAEAHQDNNPIEDKANEKKTIENNQTVDHSTGSNDSEITKLEINENIKITENTLNVLITNVSPVSVRDGKTQTRKYVDGDGNAFTGEMTNEAPIKSIAHRLGKDGYCLNKILFIESDKVKTKEVHLNNKDYTHIDYLKEKVDIFLGDYKERTEYVDIDIKDEPSKDDVSSTVFDIYNRLLGWTEEYKNVNIFIESNGGVRYVLTMLLSLTKTLENYYENVHISEITSMVLNRNPVVIMNTKDVFDTAQITGIAEEFVNYGRISGLQHYIDGHKEGLKNDHVNEINVVLKKLNQTTDDLQLCRTAMILDDFYGNNNLKETIENFLKRYPDNNSNTTVTIFAHILKIILNELSQTIYRKPYDMSEENPAVYLPRAIEWCLNKSFVQQALTLSTEKLSEYLFVTKKIRLGKEFCLILKDTNTGVYERNYYFFAHLQDFISKIKDSQINGALEHIKAKNLLPFEDEKDWQEIYITSQIPSSEISPTLSTIITENLIKLINDYTGKILQKSVESSDLTETDLIEIFVANGFTAEDLNRNVQISNNVDKNPLGLTLRGNYINKDGRETTHANLETLEDRIKKSLPKLVSMAIDKADLQIISKAKEDYDKIIDSLSYPPLISLNLKNKFSKEQSKKFYVKSAINAGQIILNEDRGMNSNSKEPENTEDRFQKLLYVYSLCKEQRNMSNHAHVPLEDEKVALNTENLKILIQKLLKLCE